MSEQNLAIYKDFEKHDRGVDEAKRAASNGIIVMAYHLKAIKEGKLYKAQGDDGQNTWASYCGQKGINKNTADKYISLYAFYIEDMGKKPEEISDMSIDSLSRYQSALKKAEPEKREELFQTMKAGLSITDLHKTFVEEKLAKPQWLVIKTCDLCGKHEIHYVQEELCSCKEGVGPAIYVKPVI